MMHGDIGMADVEVENAWLMGVLHANREAHGAAFKTAVERFAALAESRLQDLIAQVRAGKVLTLHVPIPVPEEHTADYDRALKMLAAHVGTTVALPEAAYRCLVDDEWGWRRSFLSNTMAYMTSYPPADAG